jgi:hypothetical protein
VVVLFFRLCCHQLAFGGLPHRFRCFQLCLRRQILTLRVIHLLLRNQARLAVRHAFEPRELQVIYLYLRFHSVNLVLGLADHVLLVFDGSRVLLQLHLQLRDFQDRKKLALLYPVPVIHQELLDIPRLLGEHVDLLKRHQFRGYGDLAHDRFSSHRGDPYRYGLRWRLGIAGTDALSGASREHRS